MAKEHIRYIDELDREHYEGKLPNGRIGVWTTLPGFRFDVSNGDIELVAKKDTILYRIWEMLNG